MTIPPNRLLIIDDDVTSRMTLDALLSEEVDTIEEAGDYDQAVARLSAGETIDAIILDMHLGDRMGTELVPLIRQAHPDAHLLVFTGAPEKVDPELARSATVLTKGGRVEKLFDALGL